MTMVSELTSHTCIMIPPQKTRSIGFRVLSLVNTLGGWESGVFAESMEALGPLSIHCPRHLFYLAIPSPMHESEK